MPSYQSDVVKYIYLKFCTWGHQNNILTMTADLIDMFIDIDHYTVHI